MFYRLQQTRRKQKPVGDGEGTGEVRGDMTQRIASLDVVRCCLALDCRAWSCDIMSSHRFVYTSRCVSVTLAQRPC